MSRPLVYVDLFNLNIGEELILMPRVGESVTDALARYKRAAAKWLKSGKAYRFKCQDDQVIAQRTPIGRNGVLSDWYMMAAGTGILLKTSATAEDERRARSIATYIMKYRSNLAEKREAQGKNNDQWHVGIWSVECFKDGRLVAFCIDDLDGNWTTHSHTLTAKIYNMWGGEWK